jgi:drug/metabolite transporter (DMT)-like permease
MKAAMAVLLASFSAVFFGISNICFKKGTLPLGEFTLERVTSLGFLGELVTSKWIIAGVLLTIAAGVFYISAISYGDVVRVVAVLSLSYLVTAGLASLFLEESLTFLKAGGLGLIILGVVLVHIRG